MTEKNISKIIDGKKIATDLKKSIKKRVEGMSFKPGLAVILVGQDAASHVYVRNKIKACHEVGIESYEYKLPDTVSQDEVTKLIKDLSLRSDVHGILLQLPLPEHIRAESCIMAMDPRKDVDGLHPVNIGKLVAGQDTIVPCTPQGSLILLKTVLDDMRGLNAVVIGRSLLFGKPMAQLLLQENCTVTQCHSRTRDIENFCRGADILVAAVGKAEMIKGDWIKKNAVVIDVGINRIEDASGKQKLVGDVAFDEAANVASAITPVPGGVGPMTIACLLANTVKAAAVS